jgi:N-acetylneuraminic acid mutarotase
MKTALCSLFVACLLFTAAADALDDWTQQFPGSHPSARDGHGMAYIGGDQVVLFGGDDDETWVYDFSANAWTEMFPASNPSARREHAMAYIGEDQVMLFGGYDGLNDDETWVYDLGAGTWTQMSPASKPSVRREHAMAYIGEDKVLMFGGWNGSNRNDETWVYDLSADTWTQMSPASKPSARRSSAMAYIGGDQVALFGGYDAWYNDSTWVYDLSTNTWTEMFPATNPSARREHAMAHIGGDQVILFGGETAGGFSDETWVYDLSTNTWIQDFNTTQPSARDGFRLSETSMDGSSHLVLFGGNDGLLDDETWWFGDGDYIPIPDPPQVTVTYPNGEESLADSVTITWTASDPDPGETNLMLIDLDYSANAGTTWSAIDSNQANDSAYVWDISGVPDGNQYLVRITVTDTTGLLDSDTSDAVFTIYNPDPPQVIVIYPNGGEILALPDTITWTATDPDPGETVLLFVALDYSADAGTTWSVIDSNQANDGAHYWDISELSDGTDYLVRITVTDTIGLSDCDTSDAVFEINDPPPHIGAIQDIPEDQGRQVSVLWDRSGLDQPAYQVITHYSIWRKTPQGSKIVAIGDNWDGSPPEDLSGIIYRVIQVIGAKGEVQKGYWELVGTQEAHYFEGYSYTAPTLYDSSASNPAYFSFIVSAHTSDPYVFYDSAPDSGYSVDDVNPAKTQVGIMASGSAKGSVNTIWLAWTQVTTGDDGSPEQGPIDYNVYCNEISDFTPGPENLLVTTAELSYPHTDVRIDDPGANLYYLVTATDGSGNESAISNVVGEFDRNLISGP